MDLSGHPVLVVMAIAVASALLAEVRIGPFRLPIVVLEMIFGITIGPHVLGFVKPGGLIGWLGGTLGLPALFFMAGLDLDLGLFRGRPLSLAVRGWMLSFALGLCAGGILDLLGVTRAPILLATMLATTALGTLLPILRDSGELETNFGRLVLAAGALGEFGPIILVSLLFARESSHWQSAGLMLAFVAIAFSSAIVALRARPPKVLELLGRTMHSSAQLPVLVTMLLLASLVVLSEGFGLESALGAFAAGMVVGLATRGEEEREIHEKIDAITFGFLVPFFFVTSGLKFDLAGLVQSAQTLLLVPVFLLVFLVVRGGPVFLYREDLVKGERIPFALYASTTLPMVVAISEIGVRTGRISPDVAAALVGAAMLSVLLFPAMAGALRARSALLRPFSDMTMKTSAEVS